MAQRGSIVVRGVFGPDGIIAAAEQAGKDTETFVREALREVGQDVKAGASQRFYSIDAKSAAGYRTIVRKRGVTVEQSLPRTTGLHPEFGVLQMERALMPSLVSNAGNVERRMFVAIDKVADHFERGH